MTMQLMNSTLNKLKTIVNHFLSLPASGDFEIEKKKRVSNDIYCSLDKDWITQESITFRQILPLVDIRQNQQRYARQVHRAMEFLKYCDSGYTRFPVEPNATRLEDFFRRNKWETKQDFKKVSIFIILVFLSFNILD